MGGGGFGGYGGGYGGPVNGYAGAYGGGGPYRGGRRDALQRSPEQSTEGQPGVMDRAAEKEPRARRMAPGGSLGPDSGQVRALSIESMGEKPRAAVFNQMVANKVPESLLKRRPDRVITLRAKEPMQAVRQVVKLANDQQVGVQLRFVPSPVQGRDNVELAMEVSHTVYNMLARDLARAFGVKPKELLSMGLSTDVSKETAYMYLGEAMRKSEPDAKPAEKDDSQSVRKELKQTEAEEGLAMRQESKAQAEKGGEDEKAEQQKPRPAEEGENINFVVRVLDEPESSEKADEAAGSPPQ